MIGPDRYTCEQAFQRLDDYLDREISPVEMGHVEEHLRLCEVCAQEFRFEAGLIRTLRARLARIQAPDGMMGRISELLSAEGQADPPEEGPR